MATYFNRDTFGIRDANGLAISSFNPGDIVEGGNSPGGGWSFAGNRSYQTTNPRTGSTNMTVGQWRYDGPPAPPPPPPAPAPPAPAPPTKVQAQDPIPLLPESLGQQSTGSAAQQSPYSLQIKALEDRINDYQKNGLQINSLSDQIKAIQDSSTANTKSWQGAIDALIQRQAESLGSLSAGLSDRISSSDAKFQGLTNDFYGRISESDANFQKLAQGFYDRTAQSDAANKQMFDESSSSFRKLLEDSNASYRDQLNASNTNIKSLIDDSNTKFREQMNALAKAAEERDKQLKISSPTMVNDNATGFRRKMSSLRSAGRVSRGTANLSINKRVGTSVPRSSGLNIGI